MRVNYAIVFVSDMKRAVSFYRDVVGLPLRIYRRTCRKRGLALFEREVVRRNFSGGGRPASTCYFLVPVKSAVPMPKSSTPLIDGPSTSPFIVMLNEPCGVLTLKASESVLPLSVPEVSTSP